MAWVWMISRTDQQIALCSSRERIVLSTHEQKKVVFSWHTSVRPKCVKLNWKFQRGERGL